MSNQLPVDLHAGGFAYIRARYGVPAQRMGRVTYCGEPGIITHADKYLIVRLDTRPYKGSRVIVHPADHDLVYL